MQFDLRRRLALALIGLSVGLACVLAAALLLGNSWVESATLDRVLGGELEVYIGSGAAAAGTDASAVRYYRPAKAGPALPPDLQRLEPGSYRDFQLGLNRVHVLVREVAPGDRAYLLYNVETFSKRERWLHLALLGGVLAAALVAWLASGWIAERALQPLDALVQRIRAIDPAQRGQRLETWAEDGELDVIVSALNDHMAQLDALVTRERAFAAAASHELRTPLAAIRGAAEVLEVVRQVPREVLERIEGSVAEAVADLDALLALSQGRDLPLPEPLRLHELLPRLTQTYSAQAHDNDTRLSWTASPPVTLAAARGVIAIIFTNLLRNAIRAAPGGEVRLGLDAQSFTVADDGAGMTAAELATVFEPGARGAHGGSGMGLYIARTLALRCGWELTLQSEAGKGTVARLRFG